MNPRRQSPFGIGRFALINLCLLCSLELGLELVAQSEQSSFCHFSCIVHVEDEGLKDDDICSIPTILRPHW